MDILADPGAHNKGCLEVFPQPPKGRYGQIEGFLPSHLRPIWSLQDAGRITLAALHRGGEMAEKLPAGPCIVMVGDDQEFDRDDSKGPKAFHAPALKHVFDRARAVLIVSAGPDQVHYGLAAATAALGFSAVIVETGPKAERAWMAYVSRLNLPTIMVTPSEDLIAGATAAPAGRA